MTAPEFSRPVKARQLPAAPLVIEPNAEERALLAKRFGVVAIDKLRAEVALRPDKDLIVAEGTLAADLVQTCAVSHEDFPVRVEEQFALRFVPQAGGEVSDEVELEPEPDEWDEIEYDGDTFDIGEAIAQSLGLAIDPYACGPEADAVRKEAGIVADGAARGPLANLLRDLKKG